MSPATISPSGAPAGLHDDDMLRAIMLIGELMKKIAPRLSGIPAGDYYDLANSLFWVVEYFASDDLDAAGEELHLTSGMRLFVKQDAAALKAIALLMFLDVVAARPEVIQTVVERLRTALRAALLDDEGAPHAAARNAEEAGNAE